VRANTDPILMPASGTDSEQVSRISDLVDGLLR
jgi:hypothetical protein